ncbi:MAG: tRNA-(ms[2]io[6]A)-hydroxylase [Proteobacteria bacterium]|nr:tRNA-(ms[2]io[6]A)-hydroxylase [Pseudomonadota bacterium]
MDHASAEKKASGMALNIASHYPDKPDLLLAMADLAVEELTHYREVIRLLTRRGLAPEADRKDAYVGAMNQLIRRGSELFLLDRLLVAAVVECRGHERFSLIAQVLPEGAERRFYQAIAASENRHWQLFVDLANRYFKGSIVAARLVDLCDQEGHIMTRLPLRAALH